MCSKWIDLTIKGTLRVKSSDPEFSHGWSVNHLVSALPFLSIKTCSWWESKSPSLESDLQTLRITERLNHNSQDRLCDLGLFVVYTESEHPSQLLRSRAELLFPHTGHENWQTARCTHKNWQIEELLKNLPIYLLGRLYFSTTNVATELRACIAHTALSLFWHLPS